MSSMYRAGDSIFTRGYPWPRLPMCSAGEEVGVDVDVAVEVEETPALDLLQSDGGRWTILVHNDDVTPYDFVILVLRHIFTLSVEIAEHVTWQAHIKGVAPVCSRGRDEAERLIDEAHAAARANGFPLTFTMDHKE